MKYISRAMYQKKLREEHLEESRQILARITLHLSTPSSSFEVSKSIPSSHLKSYRPDTVEITNLSNCDTDIDACDSRDSSPAISSDCQLPQNILKSEDYYAEDVVCENKYVKELIAVARELLEDLDKSKGELDRDVDFLSRLLEEREEIREMQS